MTDVDKEVGGAPNQPPTRARASIESRFGQLVLLAARHRRYQQLSVGDLRPLLLAPLLADCVAAGELSGEDGGPGAAIWCSVSQDVSTRIAAEADRGAFPIRLAREEWRSGDQIWLIDVIAADAKVGTAVFAGFSRLIRGPFRMHPQVTHSIDPDTAKRIGDAAAAASANV